MKPRLIALTIFLTGIACVSTVVKFLPNDLEDDSTIAEALLIDRGDKMENRITASRSSNKPVDDQNSRSRHIRICDDAFRGFAQQLAKAAREFADASPTESAEEVARRKRNVLRYCDAIAQLEKQRQSLGNAE